MSTLVLKQHYIVDVFSGFGLATTIFFLVKTLFEGKGLYQDNEKMLDEANYLYPDKE